MNGDTCQWREPVWTGPQCGKPATYWVKITCDCPDLDEVSGAGTVCAEHILTVRQGGTPCSHGRPTRCLEARSLAVSR